MLILCILRISFVVSSISSNNPRIMIIIFQHLNWCSNNCWLLFNNNKQHHRVSTPSYTFDFEQRVHPLPNMTFFSNGQSNEYIVSTIMIILYICGLGDGDYCDFKLSVLMIHFFILFWFESSHVCTTSFSSTTSHWSITYRVDIVMSIEPLSLSSLTTYTLSYTL